MVVGITCGLILAATPLASSVGGVGRYVLILLPVSGIVQSGPQITADRYTYLACMPWAVMVAAGVYRVWRSWTWPLGRWQLTAAATGVVMLLGLSVRTSEQTRVWKDSLTLWNHVLSIEPNNFFAYNNRGHTRYDAATSMERSRTSIGPIDAQPERRQRARQSRHRAVWRRETPAVRWRITT